DPHRLVRLGNPAILEGEREALGNARLAEEPARLRPAGRDVAAVAGELLQLRWRRGPGRPRHLNTRDLLHHRDAGEVARGLMAVEGEGQCPPDSLVVEWLAIVIDGDQREAVPGALLDGDLRSHRLHE